VSGDGRDLMGAAAVLLYQGRETKLRKLKSSDSRSGCMKLVEFLIIHGLSPACD